MLHFEQWGKGSWSSILKSGWWGGANYANNYRQLTNEHRNRKCAENIMDFKRLEMHAMRTNNLSFFCLPVLKVAPTHSPPEACPLHFSVLLKSLRLPPPGSPRKLSGPLLALCVRLVVMSYGPCGYVQALT